MSGLLKIQSRRLRGLFPPPEPFTDPYPEGRSRPLAEGELILCHTGSLALIAERMPLACCVRAGAVFADGRGHGYSSSCGCWFNLLEPG